MTRVTFRPTLGAKVYGNLERRTRGLEMRVTDGGGDIAVDDVMIDVGAHGNTHLDSISPLPQDRCYLDVTWTAQIDSPETTAKGFLVATFNADTSNTYFSRADVLDPSTNGQPFANFQTSDADTDVINHGIIVGFVNSYFLSADDLYASGKFRLPNYAVTTTGSPATSVTTARQLIGEAVLGGGNSPPTAAVLVQGAWATSVEGAPPITSIQLRLYNYTSIAGAWSAITLGQGSRMTIVGPRNPGTRLVPGVVL